MSEFTWDDVDNHDQQHSNNNGFTWDDIESTSTPQGTTDFDSMSEEELYAEHQRRTEGVGKTTPDFGVGSALETDEAITKRRKKIVDFSKAGLIGEGKKWLGKKNGEEVFEYNAENAPAFAPQSEKGKALYERVKGYKGATLRHDDRPMRINRNDDGVVESYSTTESTVVPEIDGTWSVIPTMWRGENGEIVSAADDIDAATHYRDTEKGEVGEKVGERYGNFATKEEALLAAKEIHELHADMYQQKWNLWLHEHWDEVPKNIKDEPAMRKAHEEWEKAGKPGIRFGIKMDGVENGKEEDKIVNNKPIGILEKLQLNLKAKTGKDYSKGEALLYTLAPMASQVEVLQANLKTAAREVLRSGDYKDEDAEEIAIAADLLGEYEDIKRTGGFSRKLMKIAAEDALYSETKGKTETEIELHRPQTAWGKFASNSLTTIGYGNSFIYGSMFMPTVPMAAGAGALTKIGLSAINSSIASVPVTVAGATERATGLANKSYEIDEYDRIKAIDDNYDALTSGIRGTAGSIAENVVTESLVGVGLDAALLGLAKLPIAKAAVEPLKKWSKTKIRSLWKSSSGEALINVGRFSRTVGQISNFQSIPSEMFEENITPIFDDVLGLGKRKGEDSDTVAEYFDKTLNWERQGDILLGIVGASLLHGAMGFVAYKSDPKVRQHIKDAKDARKVLIGDADQDERSVKALSDEEAIQLAGIYKRLSSSPKLAQEIANRLGEHIGGMMDNILSREGARMGGELEDMGVKPLSFTIPTRQGENGNLEVDFKQKGITNHLTDETASRRVVVDENTGVYIIDNEAPGSDSAYTVRDDVSGKSIDCMSIVQAQRAATNLMREQQLSHERDDAKWKYIQNLIESKYGNSNIEHYATIEEAVEAGKAQGYDVSKNRAFNVDREGWRLPNGTVILVRNNISSPWAVDKLLRHEVIGHNEKLNDVVFLNSVVETANEIESRSKEIMKNGPVVGGADRALKEAVALTIQQHPAMPTKSQEFIHSVKSWLKDHGMDFGISDSDIEVEAAKVANSMKGIGGHVRPGKVYDSGSLMSFTTQEEETNETGADEASAQPEQTQPVTPPAGEATRPLETGEAPAEVGGTIIPDESRRSLDYDVVGYNAWLTANGLTHSEENERKYINIKFQLLPKELANGVRLVTENSINDLSLNFDDNYYYVHRTSGDAANQISENGFRFGADIAGTAALVTSEEQLRQMFETQRQADREQNWSNAVHGGSHAVIMAIPRSEVKRIYSNAQHLKADQIAQAFFEIYQGRVPAQNLNGVIAITPFDAKTNGNATSSSAQSQVSSGKTGAPNVTRQAPTSASTETKVNTPPTTAESAEGGSQATEGEKKPVAERSVIEKMTEQAPVEELPVAEVFNDDTRIPNFKEGANPETGEVEPLTGEPYDLVSNPIVVMEFKDGKKVVVTGRHRLALYKRSGRKTIAARVIKESDGWTVDDAKMIDSIGNIIDEKGSVKDYVKYFEDAKPSRESAESGGFLSRPKGRLAYSIYEGASADTRAAIDWKGSGSDGQISVEQAGIIAEAAPVNAHPRNKALQRILVNKALAGLRGKKLGILARSLAEEVKNAKDTPNVGGEMQLDLFTSQEDLNLLAMEEKRADYRTKKSQEYNRIAEVLRTAMSKGGKLDLNKEYAEELGITDPKDKKQLAAARDKAVEKANYWETAIRLEDADKTAMDNEITAKADATAKKAADAKAKAEAKLAEIKAKREGKTVPKAPDPKEAAYQEWLNKAKFSDTPARRAEWERKQALKVANKKTARTAEKAPEKAEPKAQTAKGPSIKMKDEAAEKRAQKLEDELGALFMSEELSPKGSLNEKNKNVAVKAKPECCSEQNRNPEKRLVERASVHDFALKTTIVEG